MLPHGSPEDAADHSYRLQVENRDLRAEVEQLRRLLTAIQSLTETAQWENVDTRDKWRAYMEAIHGVLTRVLLAQPEGGREGGSQ